MSLEAVTRKIDGIISAVVLVVSGILWATAGFPHLMAVIAIVSLVVICFSGYMWMTPETKK
jgi:hypothetical protein